MKDARLVLYRLPELIEAPADAAVWIAEGEPKIELLRSWGLVATCNTGGAGKWPDGFEEWFRNHTVCILPDNDLQSRHPKTGEPLFHPDGRPRFAGKDHAERIARSLCEIAESVHIVEIPGLPPKGDVVDWARSGGTAARLVEIAEAAPRWESSAEADDPSLPELVVNDSNKVAVAKQLAYLITQHRGFLSNGNEPIQVLHDDGMPRAVTVSIETVRVYAEEVCVPTYKIKDDSIHVTLPTDIAKLYLYGLVGRWNLRPLRGITTAPILADDGSLRIASGYDEGSGLWCHNVPEVGVPERPTREQAEAALAALRCFFRTFPFADATMKLDEDLKVNVVDPAAPIGLDESSFLVGLMTAVCRALLTLAPGMLATAPAFSGAGTGKGFAVKAMCVVASGASPSAFTGGHDELELDKRLTSALVEARPAIFLDNFNAKDLSSDILASALTENPCQVRPMGRTAMIPLHTRTFVAITGNAVQTAEDQVRRLLKTEFDAKCENPELRPFKPGFLDTVYKERANLLGHALTIWRWGRQSALTLTQGLPLGSYEVWATWCRDPLLALGCRDPVDRLAATKAADPKRKKIVDVFEAWRVRHGRDEIAAAHLDEAVIRVIDEKAGFHDGQLRFSRQFVARWLRDHTNTRVGGYALTRRDEGPPSKPIHKYRLEFEDAGGRGQTEMELETPPF
jgi:hypothetical protein